MKDQNVIWLRYSQHPDIGWFGYTNNWPVWGPYATTPSGMVQMVMDGLGGLQREPGESRARRRNRLRPLGGIPPLGSSK